MNSGIKSNSLRKSSLSTLTLSYSRVTSDTWMIPSLSCRAISLEPAVFWVSAIRCMPHIIIAVVFIRQKLGYPKTRVLREDLRVINKPWILQNTREWDFNFDGGTRTFSMEKYRNKLPLDVRSSISLQRLKGKGGWNRFLVSSFANYGC